MPTDELPHIEDEKNTVGNGIFPWIRNVGALSKYKKQNNNDEYGAEADIHKILPR